MSNLSKCVGNKSKCYGCGMCASICRLGVLEMQVNKRGFYVPRIVNAEACTNCGLCSRVCNYESNDASEFNKPIDSFGGWSNIPEVRIMCSSGGVGFEIGKLLLAKGFKACAVRYDTELREALHFIADNVEDFKRSIGSKYIQSNTYKAFQNVNSKEKYVVFGTPCQIDMWRRYLKLLKKEDNFILVDFFCHGVPSRNVWLKYLKEQKAKMGPYKTITWRDKSRGWHCSWNIAAYPTSDFWRETPLYRSSACDGDPFYFMFLSNCALNPTCYSECKYKGLNSSADIRLGDLWGNLYAEDDKGVSGVLAYTLRGKQVLSEINCTLTPLSNAQVMEGQMKETIKKPWYYDLVALAVNSDKVKLPAIRKIFVFSEIIGYQLSKIKSKFVS